MGLIMKKVLVLILFVAVFVAAYSPAQAGKADEFKQIKILDDIMVFVDVEDDALDAVELKAHAIKAFKSNMRGMEVNNDAVVDNYPAEGYTLEDVGYILLKVMSIRSSGGVNIYHLNFEFGIPPRQVYWDTAMMGVAPTSLDMKKEVSEDIDEVMKEFADAFFMIRGE